MPILSSPRVGLYPRFFLLFLAASVASCGSAPGPAAGGPVLSEALSDLLNHNTEIAAANALVEAGECARALPQLTVYLSRSQDEALASFVLGRAYLCVGEHLKAASHLRRAATLFAKDPATADRTRADVAAVAFAGAEALAGLLEQGNADTYERLKATSELYALALLTPHRSTAATAALRRYALKLSDKGSDAAALAVVRTMKALGAPPADTLDIEAMALVKLGESDALQSLVKEEGPALADGLPDFLYRLAQAAEASFHADEALFLFVAARDRGVAGDAVHLDVLRASLKAGKTDLVSSAGQAYLEASGPAQADTRHLEVSSLLSTYGRKEEAARILDACVTLVPTSFPCRSARAALLHKEPGSPGLVEGLADYVSACGHSAEALARVGDLLLEWKQAVAGLALLDRVGSSCPEEPVAFYRGAFQWLGSDRKKAEAAFDRSVAAAADKVARLDRIAGFLTASGSPADALEYLARAESSDPGNVAILLKMAEIKEAGEVGSGIRLVDKRAHAGRMPAADLLKVAAWMRGRSHHEAALRYAEAALAAAGPAERPDALLLKGTLALDAADTDAASAAFAAALDAASDVNAVAVEVLRRVADAPLVATSRLAPGGTGRSARFDRFIHSVAARVSPVSLLQGRPLELAASAGVATANVSPDILAAYVAAAAADEPGLARLLSEAGDSRTGAAILDAMAGCKGVAYATAELNYQAALVAAMAGRPGPAADFSRKFVALSGRDGGTLARLGRILLLHGAREAAVAVLAAAYQKASGREQLEAGLVLAAVELTTGDRATGLEIVDRLLALPGRNSARSAAVAGLLIEAGEALRAADVLLEALRDHVEDEPGLGDGEPPDGQEDPGAMLDLESLLREPGEREEDAGRLLVSQLAHAWILLGRAPEELAAAAMPAVEPWHGGPLVADVLMAMGAAGTARSVLAAQLEKAPANFGVYSRFVDAVVFADMLEGLPLQASLEQADEATARFVSARAGDGEALRQAATYLQEKGFSALAVKYLGKLVESGQRDPETVLALAAARAAAGEEGKGADDFRLSLSLSGCNVATLGSVRDQLERVGGLALASQLTEECATRYPRDARLRLARGRALLLSGVPERAARAEAELDKAVALDQGLARLAAEAGQAAGRNDLALKYAHMMVKSRDPDVAMAGIELGFAAAAALGDVPEMKRLGSELLRNNSSDSYFVTGLSDKYFAYNLDSLGMETLAAAASNGNKMAGLLLSVRLIAAGNVRDGYPRLDAYLDAEFFAAEPMDGNAPDEAYPTFQTQLDFLVDAGKPDKAVALLERAAKRFPSDRRVRLELAYRLALQGAFDTVGRHLMAGCSRGISREETDLGAKVLNVLLDRGKLAPVTEELLAAVEAGEAPRCIQLLAHALTLSQDGRGIAWLAARAAGDLAVTSSDLLDLAELLVSRGQWEAGRQALAAAQSRGWGDPDLIERSFAVAARLASATGRRGTIRDTVRSALIQAEGHPDTRLQVAQRLLELEYLDEAGQQLEILAIYQADSIDPSLRLLQLALMRGDSAKALEVAARASYAGSNLLNRLLSFAESARSRAAFGVALELYRNALALDPTNRPLLFNVAELELVVGDPGRAWEAFTTYARSGEPSPRAALEVVQNMVRYDHVGMAAAFLVDADGPEAALAVALGLVRSGDVARATGILAPVLATSDGALQGRALLESYVQRPFLLPEAVRAAALAAACPSGGTGVECRFYKALDALAAGDPRPLSDLATLLEGSDRKWHYTLAAFKALARAGKLQPARNVLSSGMAGFRKDQVLNEAMKTLFQVLLEESPEASRRIELAGLAATLAEELLARNPLDFWMMTQVAESRYLSGSLAAARAAYDADMKLLPWEAGLKNNLAYMLARSNVDVDAALALVGDALAREPANGVFYLDTLGWLQYLKGDYPAAYANVHAALARAHIGYGESLSESLYHLGRIAQDQGNTALAVSWYRHASFLDPFGEYGNLSRERLRSLGQDPYRRDWKPATLDQGGAR